MYIWQSFYSLISNPKEKQFRKGNSKNNCSGNQGLAYTLYKIYFNNNSLVLYIGVYECERQSTCFKHVTKGATHDSYLLDLFKQSHWVSFTDIQWKELWMIAMHIIILHNKSIMLKYLPFVFQPFSITRITGKLWTPTATDIIYEYDSRFFPRFYMIIENNCICIYFQSVASCHIIPDGIYVSSLS